MWKCYAYKIFWKLEHPNGPVVYPCDFTITAWVEEKITATKRQEEKWRLRVPRISSSGFWSSMAIYFAIATAVAAAVADAVVFVVRLWSQQCK